ncbi:unnamed protein product [Meloidogyne enterolobii]|uniref:Uncharacterized protein n=1 Tax=Meloidogyne enterolobii TaxID=390850 RepID=A0ACB0YU97_MELEN
MVPFRLALDPRVFFFMLVLSFFSFPPTFLFYVSFWQPHLKYFYFFFFNVTAKLPTYSGNLMRILYLEGIRFWIILVISITLILV